MYGKERRRRLDLAALCLLLDDRDGAYYWLERWQEFMLKDEDSPYYYIDFEPIWDEARFQEIMKGKG